MEQDEAKKFISGVYKYLLGRVPGDGEFSHWISEAQSGRPPSDLIRLFGEGLELKQKNRIKTEYYSGHFHSPIVDPEQVVDYVRSNRTSDLGGIKGVNLSMDSMIEFWTDFEAEVPSIPFTSEKRFGRYYYENGFFPPGDAIALYAHFIKYRPQRVIEIGSGFSSACMLDIADHLDLSTEFVLIEPYADRLKSLLRPEDWTRVVLEERPVQQAQIEVFSELESGDILFIDSTHVLKTGSDVHYELCKILPCLKPGVLVHFHDIHFPFEYPDDWIFTLNKSWNEVYAIRLFLMYNTRFEVHFWGSALAYFERARIAKSCPSFLLNPGGSLWLRCVGD